MIHTSHLFHVLKIHYNALVKGGVIDTEPVMYSVFSRNFNPVYIAAHKDRVAYNIVRMIVELANRSDLELNHKYYFEQIVENLYNYFMDQAQLKKLKSVAKSEIAKTVPRMGF